MVNVAEIYAKYGDMKVLCEDIDLDDTLRSYFEWQCAEAEIDEFCEVTAIMNAVIENGAPEDDEQMVAFLTFLSYLTFPGELFDADDDTSVQFEFDGNIFFDGTVSELKEKYSNYLAN